MEKPEVMRNVMVTYMKEFGYGHYGIEKRMEQVTKRGFLTDSDGYYNKRDQWIETPEGYYAVPPSWQEFKGILLPHGWGGDRLNNNEVLKWVYCKD